MAKIKTKEALEDILDKEVTWRSREITDLKILLKDYHNKNHRLTPTLSKATVILAYSHWEGFVRTTARAYLEYVKFLGLNNSQIHPTLLSATLFNKLLSSTESKDIKIERIVRTLTNLSEKPVIEPDRQTDAESNLNLQVLRKIIANIGMSISSFEREELKLDKILAFRNAYAHGDKKFIEPVTALQLAQDCTNLMTTFKTLVSNAIAQNLFRKPTSTR